MSGGMNKVECGNPPKKGGMGCWLKGCIIVFVIALAIGIYVALNITTWTRGIAAMGIEKGTEVALIELKLPEDERKAIMVPVTEFAEKVGSGEIGMQEAFSVMEELAQGPVFAAIAARSFELGYVNTSALSETDKAEAKVTISRFMQGAIEEKIDKASVEKLARIITVEVVGKKERQLKKTLTPEELTEALEIMKTEADKAKVEMKIFEVNLADELRKAIDEGMNGKTIDEEINESISDVEEVSTTIEVEEELNETEGKKEE